MEESKKMGTEVCTGFLWMAMAKKFPRKEQKRGGENIGKDMLQVCSVYPDTAERSLQRNK